MCSMMKAFRPSCTFSRPILLPSKRERKPQANYIVDTRTHPEWNGFRPYCRMPFRLSGGGHLFSSGCHPVNKNTMIFYQSTLFSLVRKMPFMHHLRVKEKEEDEGWQVSSKTFGRSVR